jgi:UDP-N-acetylglucosamine 2-epimerase (non-hydrolysing)
MQNILIVIGTRPNFIKVTQFKRVAKEQFPHINISIVHTGQHYDEKMADVFFRQFNLTPDYFLNIGSGTPNQQIAQIILKLEELCSRISKPDLVIVPGDVNSTLAAAKF